MQKIPEEDVETAVKACDCESPNCTSLACINPNKIVKVEGDEDYVELEFNRIESDDFEAAAEAAAEAAPEIPAEEKKEESPQKIEVPDIERSWLNECLCSLEDEDDFLLQKYIEHFTEHIHYTKYLQKLVNDEKLTKLMTTGTGTKSPKCKHCKHSNIPNKKDRTAAINRRIDQAPVNFLNSMSCKCDTKVEQQQTKKKDLSEFLVIKCPITEEEEVTYPKLKCIKKTTKKKCSQCMVSPPSSLTSMNRKKAGDYCRSCCSTQSHPGHELLCECDHGKQQALQALIQELFNKFKCLDEKKPCKCIGTQMPKCCQERHIRKFQCTGTQPSRMRCCSCSCSCDTNEMHIFQNSKDKCIECNEISLGKPRKSKKIINIKVVNAHCSSPVASKRSTNTKALNEKSKIYTQCFYDGTNPCVYNARNPPVVKAHKTHFKDKLEKICSKLPPAKTKCNCQQFSCGNFVNPVNPCHCCNSNMQPRKQMRNCCCNNQENLLCDLPRVVCLPKARNERNEYGDICCCVEKSKLKTSIKHDTSCTCEPEPQNHTRFEYNSPKPMTHTRIECNCPKPMNNFQQEMNSTSCCGTHSKSCQCQASQVNKSAEIRSSVSTECSCSVDQEDNLSQYDIYYSDKVDLPYPIPNPCCPCQNNNNNNNGNFTGPNFNNMKSFGKENNDNGNGNVLLYKNHNFLEDYFIPESRFYPKKDNPKKTQFPYDKACNGPRYCMGLGPQFKSMFPDSAIQVNSDELSKLNKPNGEEDGSDHQNSSASSIEKSPVKDTPKRQKSNVKVVTPSEPTSVDGSPSEGPATDVIEFLAKQRSFQNSVGPRAQSTGRDSRRVSMKYDFPQIEKSTVKVSKELTISEANSKDSIELRIQNLRQHLEKHATESENSSVKNTNNRDQGMSIISEETDGTSNRGQILSKNNLWSKNAA